MYYYPTSPCSSPDDRLSPCSSPDDRISPCSSPQTPNILTKTTELIKPLTNTQNIRRLSFLQLPPSKQNHSNNQFILPPFNLIAEIQKFRNLSTSTNNSTKSTNNSKTTVISIHPRIQQTVKTVKIEERVKRVKKRGRMMESVDARQDTILIMLKEMNLESGARKRSRQ